MLNKINREFSLHNVDIRTYSPLALAFIGDSVFATVVKTIVIEKGNTHSDKLHRKSAHLVCAQSQALMYEKWREILSTEEADVLKRGKNAKAVNTTKNASEEDYRKATAVETLTGYLFLQGREERLIELIRIGIEAVDATDC